MMPKRKDTLTGGTGDVNPQILTITATQTAADTTTIIQQPLPIPRYPTAKGRNLVMEFLWVDYYDIIATTTAANTTQLITITTNPTAFANSLTAIQDARLLDAWWRVVTFATAVGFLEKPVERYQDLTDANGHGILVAADNLYVGTYSTGTTYANSAVIKLAYRWKEVSLEEYIGIVQSQQ